MKQQRRGGFLVGQIHQASGRAFARILRRNGIRLSPPQGRVLFALWQNGSMPIAQIGHRAGLGKSTLTGILDRLERDGHVRRVRSTADRRIVLVEPTAQDTCSQAVFVRASEQMTALYYEGFAPAEINRFESDLDRILDNLRRRETAGLAAGSPGVPSTGPTGSQVTSADVPPGPQAGPRGFTRAGRRSS